MVAPFSDKEEGKKTPASNTEDGHPVKPMHIETVPFGRRGNI